MVDIKFNSGKVEEYDPNSNDIIELQNKIKKLKENSEKEIREDNVMEYNKEIVEKSEKLSIFSAKFDSVTSCDNISVIIFP